jgi:hypothetical protein
MGPRRNYFDKNTKKWPKTQKMCKKQVFWTLTLEKQAESGQVNAQLAPLLARKCAPGAV